LALKEVGIDKAYVDAVVISSVGVLPEHLWNHPVALAYDAGVPDIYRTLRLVREFFSARRYEKIVDCLEFQPYTDCLEIAQREGLIGCLAPGPRRRRRRLPEP
jgi:hypothetical protein